ncbi:hypothetical protein HDU93_003286 [Gonapodya sp. JEL0774]|nr:hypothetical protein HDU93_003286 [Gonapodya sp. JEL0774]
MDANDDDFCDYFNASYITSHPYYTPSSNPPTSFAHPALTSHPTLTTYIAAQGPIAPTSGDMWRCVWEHKTSLIVMLTGLEERGIQKCARYWPGFEGLKEKHNFSLGGGLAGAWSVQVQLVAEEAKGHEVIVRKFKVVGEGWDGEEVGGKWSEEREVRQLHFVGWPDHGVPKRPSSLLSLIRLANSPPFLSTVGPPIIHCSAGVGRTGTYIAVDFLTKCLAEVKRDRGKATSLTENDGGQLLSLVRADPPKGDPVVEVVRHLRRQRCLMVQTGDQFCYVYACVAEAATGVSGQALKIGFDYDDRNNILMTPTKENKILAYICSCTGMQWIVVIRVGTINPMGKRGPKNGAKRTAERESKATRVLNGTKRDDDELSDLGSDDVDIKTEDEATPPPEDFGVPLFRVVVGSYERFVYGINVYPSAGVEVDELPAADEDLKERDTNETSAAATTTTKSLYNLAPLFVHPAHVSSIKALASNSPRSSFLASGSVDESIRLYDLRRLRELGSLFHHQGTISRLAFVGNGHLLSAGEDGKLCVWRTRDWELVKEMKGHSGKVIDMAVHPSGKVALTIGDDKTLRCWNLLTASLVLTAKLPRLPVLPSTTYQPPTPPLPERIAFSPSGNHYILMWPAGVMVCQTSSSGSRSREGESEDGKDTDEDTDEDTPIVIRPPKNGKVVSACVATVPISGSATSALEDVVVLGLEDKSVRLFTITGAPIHDTKNAISAPSCTARIKCVAYFHLPPSSLTSGSQLSANAVAPPTPTHILATATSAGTVCLWDLVRVVAMVRDGRAANVNPVGVFEAACRVTCMEVVGMPKTGGSAGVGGKKSQVKEEKGEEAEDVDVKSGGNKKNDRKRVGWIENTVERKAGVKRKAEDHVAKEDDVEEEGWEDEEVNDEKAEDRLSFVDEDGEDVDDVDSGSDTAMQPPHASLTAARRLPTADPGRHQQRSESQKEQRGIRPGARGRGDLGRVSDQQERGAKSQGSHKRVGMEGQVVDVVVELEEEEEEEGAEATVEIVDMAPVAVGVKAACNGDLVEVGSAGLKNNLREADLEEDVEGTVREVIEVVIEGVDGLGAEEVVAVAVESSVPTSMICMFLYIIIPASGGKC